MITIIIALVRYSIPFLKWTAKEIKQMDHRTRKLMNMLKSFNPRDDVDIQFVPRKEGERGLASIEESVDASIQRLENYLQKRGGRLITGTRKILTTQRLTMYINRKQKQKEKQINRHFKQLISNI